MGLYLEVLGVLSTMVAVGTGYFLTGSPMDGESGTRGKSMSFLPPSHWSQSIVAAFFRVLHVYLKKEETKLKYVALALFFLAAVFVSITGHFGGTGI